MKTRKLLCAALIVAIFITLPFDVRAAEIPVGDTLAVRLDSSLRLPEINVMVPSGGTMIINPYRMSVEIGATVSSGQIISEPAFIENYSDVDIQVDVAITAEINEGSTMTLATSSTAGSASTSKKAFIYFEMHAADTDDWTRVAWDSAYSSKSHVKVSAATENSKENIAVLSACTMDGDVAPGGYGAFRLTGDAIANPKDEWTDEDGLNVTVVFTFTALPFDL